jgi:alginate O-acetyltransferase complex protein AlgI
MSFVSWHYLALLSAVYCLYWILPQTGRIRLLLGASYLFYGYWDTRFLALILASTAIDYICGRGVNGERPKLADCLRWGLLPVGCLLICRLADFGNGPVSGITLTTAGAFPLILASAVFGVNRLTESRRRWAFLMGSLGGNLLGLMFFKYFGFFAESFRQATAMAGIEITWVLPAIVLPVGISFYTFQSLSYTIDIYRGRMKPVDRFLPFATYVAFFPQLVAGPIERAGRLLPQFLKAAKWNMAAVRSGSLLIITGYFKKVFVGDNCGLIADYAFASGNQLNGWWSALGVVAFAFQIYGDFGGYSDIARGSARLLGIELVQNFRFPYSAHSPSDFWQRWHISLSSWFRDYVYIPLGGNRGSHRKVVRNLLITMVIAGLWHGAGWMYPLWGLYHGLLLVAFRRREQTTGRRIPRNWMTTSFMFLLTLIGWAIFRCNDIGQLINWLTGFLFWSDAGLGDPLGSALWLTVHIVPLLFIQRMTGKNCDESDLAKMPAWARGFWIFIMILLVASTTDLDPEFIYFQF